MRFTLLSLGRTGLWLNCRTGHYPTPFHFAAPISGAQMNAQLAAEGLHMGDKTILPLNRLLLHFSDRRETPSSGRAAADGLAMHSESVSDWKLCSLVE